MTFKPGNKHGGQSPGRPPRLVEEKYLDTVKRNFSPTAMAKVLKMLQRKAVEQEDVRAAAVLLKCVLGSDPLLARSMLYELQDATDRMREANDKAEQMMAELAEQKKALSQGGLEDAANFVGPPTPLPVSGPPLILKNGVWCYDHTVKPPEPPTPAAKPVEEVVLRRVVDVVEATPGAVKEVPSMYDMADSHCEAMNLHLNGD
jgi:hypothetical protein